ncbi:N-acetylmuramidase domain-containing protein [Consotaella aegiceratis]|uniref:N-acetylmuramidase domain-containing protein n=1 Tax=Consotaella aegiceratis TaxID=3097961 RepID=UPI002F427C3A
MGVSRDVVDAARQVESQTGVAAAVLIAVALVETNAKAFALVGNRQEPLIRFEGHYFDRGLRGDARATARAAGLADPRAGRIANPRSQAARWRLLDRAVAIDAEAAHAATSWGLGQVMGAHWKKLGFASATDLAATARQSTAGQFDIVARFLRLGGLDRRLDRADFEGFARRYNGPGFRRNRYDDKIAVALTKARRALADPLESNMTQLGARGAAVTALQRGLCQVGLDVVVDGIFGPKTRAMVALFQARQGMVATGAADRGVFDALGVTATAG